MMLAPMKPAMAMASTIPGKEIIMSAMRMITASSTPPKWPARMPRARAQKGQGLGGVLRGNDRREHRDEKDQHHQRGQEDKAPAVFLHAEHPGRPLSGSV